MIERLLICTQTFPPRMGGIEAVMLSLATKFSNAGVDTLVATDKPYKEVSEFKVCSFAVPRLIRSFAKRILLDLKNFNPDVTICDSWKSLRALPRKSGKVIVLAHGQEYLEHERKAEIIRSLLSRADIVVASSHMTANLVRRVAPNIPIEVIYPTYMLNTPGELKKSHNSVPLIVSICRIERRKGLLQSAEALISLYNKGYRFRWVIGGSGPALGRLKEKISESAISGNSEVLGRISESTKQDLLARADLFLMPSYQEGHSLEGFGISYIEASSYGVPAIGGETGGAPEAVLDQQTGWCVDGKDPSAIESALQDALLDTDKRKAFGELAVMRFSDDLVSDRAFDKLTSIIKQICLS